MKNALTLERLTFSFAVILTYVGLRAVPSWSETPTDSCRQGFVFGVVTIVIFAISRSTGGAAVRFERAWATMFLGGMPLVYVAQSVLARPAGSSAAWPWVELAGLAVFAGLAALGVRRSPWYTVAGIAAHGVAWDAWHYLHTDYVPDWYVTGCLLVDVGLGLYLATRVPVWLRGRNRSERPDPEAATGPAGEASRSSPSSAAGRSRGRPSRCSPRRSRTSRACASSR